MMKTKKMTKLVTLLLALAMVFSLAACSSGKGKDKADGSTDIAALIATEPNSADEAAKLYQQLMQKENDILAANSELWNKVFLSANKNSTMIEDGTNYGDFLLATIESAKDGFSADELKTLKAGAEQIKEIEGKLTILEQKYPGCGTAPGAGDSVSAEEAGMTASGSDLMKFPSFQGKDLDGNDVDSSKLFAGNSVTVVNFWFTTCNPCVGELADLEALNKDLAAKGGAVVGINSFTLDGDKTAIAEAKDILAKWYKDRPEGEQGQKQTILTAKQTGYTRTLMGRYRPLPDINSRNKGNMCRAAINTPIQGGAADIVMMAMLKIEKDERLKKLGYRMLLQIHDGENERGQ